MKSPTGFFNHTATSHLEASDPGIVSQSIFVLTLTVSEPSDSLSSNSDQTATDSSNNELSRTRFSLSQTSIIWNLRRQVSGRQESMPVPYAIKQSSRESSPLPSLPDTVENLR